MVFLPNGNLLLLCGAGYVLTSAGAIAQTALRVERNAAMRAADGSRRPPRGWRAGFSVPGFGQTGFALALVRSKRRSFPTGFDVT
jgi:hypothetical protein